MSFIVAIDGPAGTGKGTIASLVSRKMGFTNIDTGATYRCVALYLLRNNIDHNDVSKVIDVLNQINIDIINDGTEQRFILNSEDVTDEIRSSEVTKIVSEVSSIRSVREKLVELQRKLAQGKDVVMEGRDITTVVFPDADVKIYLDAKEDVRVLRRYNEYIEKGTKISYEEVLENIRSRDKNDKEKEYGALKIADDAIYIDTTDLSIDEVEEKVKEIIVSKRGK